MAEKELQEEIEKDSFKEIFTIFDSESGSLSANRLRNVMKMGDVDLSEAEVKEIIKMVNLDGKGNINYAKLIFLLGAEMKKSDISIDADNAIVEAFKVFDKENKGIVKVSDLIQASSGLEPIYKKYMEQLVLKSDPRKTGHFNYHEFIQKTQGKWKNYLI